jgi:flavodoxin I
MKKIGLFWGSSTSNTEEAAKFMKEYLENEDHEVDFHDISEVDVEELLNYDNIIIGCPTWHIGELQEDWDAVFLKYEKLDFTGKTAAFFGCGDQIGYPDNFLDAIGLLGKPFMANGGKLIGKCARDDYEFSDSVALDGDMLLGLGLDYDNDEDECEGQMIMWLEDIMEDFE